MTDKTNSLSQFNEIVEKQFRQAREKRDAFMKEYTERREELSLPESASKLQTLLSEYTNIIMYRCERLSLDESIQRIKELKVEIIKMIK